MQKPISFFSPKNRLVISTLTKRKEIVKQVVKVTELVVADIPIQPILYSVKSGKGLEDALSEFANLHGILFRTSCLESSRDLRDIVPNTSDGNWECLVAVVEVRGSLKYMVTYTKGPARRLVLTIVDYAHID